MQTNNLLGQLAAATPVGSGDLLGIVVISQLWLLRAAILLECVALYLFVSILVEDYRENKQSRRQNQKSPSQPDNPARLLVHILGNHHKQCCHQRCLMRWCNDACQAMLGFHLVQRFYKFMRLWIHKKRTMPNEKS